MPNNLIVAFLPTPYSGKVTKGQRQKLNSNFLLIQKELGAWGFLPPSEG